MVETPPYPALDTEQYNSDTPFFRFSMDISTTWPTRGRISTARYQGGVILVSGTAIFPYTSSPVPTTVVYQDGLPQYEFLAGLTAGDQGTTWQVFQTVRRIRGTSWSVVAGCRGMKAFAPRDGTRLVSQGRALRTGMLPQITLCALSPNLRNQTAPTHTGFFAVVAQTRDLYMDERNFIYYKNPDLGFLGNALLIKATAYPSFVDQILTFQASLVR